MGSKGDLVDGGWLAARIEADLDRILTRYREQLDASGNALAGDDEALGQAMTNAGHVVADVAASLRAGRVRIGDGYQALAWDIGLSRAAKGWSAGSSLQAASLMFRTVLDSVARALGERPEAFGLIVTAAVALERSIMLRVRTAVAGYTGFLMNQIHGAQVTERRRIARDLHDRIGHSISVTHRQLELFDMYSEVDSGKAGQKVEAAQRAVIESMHHLRAFTSDLYEFHSVNSLESALKQFADTSAGEGVDLRIRVDGDEGWAAREVLDEVFLVLREAARNALRHGNPSTIDITVDITPVELRAFVEDDGQGFDISDRGDGFGISSMRERARLLGGTLHLRSRTGRGTQVGLVVPWTDGTPAMSPGVREAGIRDGHRGKITVLLVDDRVLARGGVREMLSAEQDIKVVGEAAHSEEALAGVAEHRPDIVLLDVEIPGRETTDTVARMRQDSPASRIVMLSGYDPPLVLRELITAGISGYLLKSVDREELVAAIRRVHLAPERMVLSISRESLGQLHRPAVPPLSDRQLTVLRLAASALSNRQIAGRMQVSEATVKRHLHSVFIKLGAASRIDAVNKAAAAGLITGDPADVAWAPDR